MTNPLKKEKGFTLIEIVLVLAIAGLLLVIVFLAVSGAQKSRRDSARKNDAAAFAAQLESNAGNAGGTYPASATMPTGFTRTDPTSGSAYNVVAASVTPNVGDIAYSLGYTCSGATATTVGANGRTYAVVIGLEQGAQACFTNK